MELINDKVPQSVTNSVPKPGTNIYKQTQNESVYHAAAIIYPLQCSSPAHKVKEKSDSMQNKQNVTHVRAISDLNPVYAGRAYDVKC